MLILDTPEDGTQFSFVNSLWEMGFRYLGRDIDIGSCVEAYACRPKYSSDIGAYTLGKDDITFMDAGKEAQRAYFPREMFNFVDRGELYQLRGKAETGAFLVYQLESHPLVEADSD